MHELGSQQIGMMAESAAILRPDIGIVTNVGHDHWTSFRDLDVVAEEKGVLVAVLPKSGTAVLNADDPRVFAMASRSKARVLTYGLDEAADVRGTEVHAVWPSRLSMDVSYQSQTVHVETQLVGAHFATSVLAALAGALAVGVPLDDAAAAIRVVPPVEGRLSVEETEDGITFLRDDWKAPLWTVPASLEVLATAEASRRIAVIGSLSDFPGKKSPKYRQVAEQALAAADLVFFVGRWAPHVLKGGHDTGGRLAAFESLHDLSRHLNEVLRAGDLVLLKGSSSADHLQRLVLDRTDDIRCWRDDCGYWCHCTNCELRLTPTPGPGNGD